MNQSSSYFSFTRLIDLLLQRGLLLTNNLRVPIADLTEFNWQELKTSDSGPADERQLPLWLFNLKNGRQDEKARFQRIQASFKKLVSDEVSFDLTATPLDGRGQGAWVKLDIRIIDAGVETSLADHGAGTWESLLLATLIEASEGRVVFLDEPASNLHPGRQRKLMGVLQGTPGQAIIITHSPHLLPTRADEFHKVRRLLKKDVATQVKGLNGFPPEPDVDKLEQKLLASSDLAGLLFASGVILVEGEHTEVPALTEWFPKSPVGKGRNFADLNIALYRVIGASSFAFYIRFLQAFGVKWVIICDGDSLEPSSWNGRPLWKALSELNLIEEVPEGEAFGEVRSQAEKIGVYTANEKPNEKFEHIPAVARYMAEHGLSPKNKADGLQVGQALSCPPEFERIFQRALQHFGVA